MQSNAYTYKFMLIVCVACALLVSTAAVGLRGRQLANQELDIQKNILEVVGLKTRDEALSAGQIRERFEKNIHAVVVNGHGDVVEGVDPKSIDLEADDKRQKIGELEASERRLPLYVYETEHTVRAYIVPIYGYGLWSTLYGYLALGPEANAVVGITFYKHGETPGLGGEVDNPQWKAQFEDKAILDDAGKLVSIQVVKGSATAADDHAVDAISGATITSRGVQNLLAKDLDRYAPFFKKHVWHKQAGRRQPAGVPPSQRGDREGHRGGVAAAGR